jgi:RNA polymerase sigma factor (sigma-70 family)
MMTTSAVSSDTPFTSIREIGHLTGLPPVGLTHANQEEEETLDLLQVYFQEVGTIPLLTASQEREFAALCQCGDEAARTRLIEANLRLVVHIAKRYQDKGVPLADLISAGNIGLVSAASKFDGEKGVRFSTYAASWIKQTIERALDDESRTIRKPASWLVTLHELLQQQHALAQELGRDPHSHELAAYTGKRVDVVERLLEQDHLTLSLDGLRGRATDDLILLEVLHDKHASDPLALLCEQEQATTLSRELELLLACLSSRERAVVILCFGLDGNGERGFVEMGRTPGLSHARSHQLLTSAFEKMRMSPSASDLRSAFVDPSSSQPAC